MTAVIRRLPSGHRILIHPCEQCGTDNAPWGFRKPNELSRWYCTPHREIGERWLRGEV